MENKIKIYVSACLLGENVRYDGKNKFDRNITGSPKMHFALIPVCPETQCGMTVPREPMHLEKRDGIRLVTLDDQIDMTDMINEWIRKQISLLEKENPCGFILKSKSPSCGLDINIFNENGVPIAKGAGLFAQAVLDSFPQAPVVDEISLKNEHVQEKFFRRLRILGRGAD